LCRHTKETALIIPSATAAASAFAAAFAFAAAAAAAMSAEWTGRRVRKWFGTSASGSYHFGTIIMVRRCK
jgi:hypothetical protein